MTNLDRLVNHVATALVRGDVATAEQALIALAEHPHTTPESFDAYLHRAARLSAAQAIQETPHAAA